MVEAITVIAIPLVLVPIAFTGGVYLANRFVPPLAPTRTGRLSGLVVAVLTGAAAATLALNAFLALRAAFADEYGGFSRADAIAATLLDALWMGGVLLAVAAAVHLLAPPPDDEM